MAAPEEAALSLLDLPTETLVLVLSSLSVDDLLAAEQVSRGLAAAVSPSLWLRLAAAGLSGDLGRLNCAPSLSPDAQPRTPRALCKRLALLAQQPPGRRSLVAEALFASSTDNPEEALSNVLTPEYGHLPHRLSYWSSAGSLHDTASDSVTFRLATRVVVVHSFTLRPFQADFQQGNPIYAPRAVRCHLGRLGEFAGGFDTPLRVPAAEEERFVAAYSSPPFPVELANAEQRFLLPAPVLCTGGVLQLELIGRPTPQASDGRFYVCLAYVAAQGTTLPGFAPVGGALHFNPRLALADGAGSGSDDAPPFVDDDDFEEVLG